jgi:hypothetical protein
MAEAKTASTGTTMTELTKYMPKDLAHLVAEYKNGKPAFNAVMRELMDYRRGSHTIIIERSDGIREYTWSHSSESKKKEDISAWWRRRVVFFARHFKNPWFDPRAMPRSWTEEKWADEPWWHGYSAWHWRGLPYKTHPLQKRTNQRPPWRP